MVKSSHLYLYSAFNNTNCDKATAQYQNGKLHKCGLSTRGGGGVQPCKRSLRLCKQSPVYYFPLLQSLHVGRTLAKLSLNLRGWSHRLWWKSRRGICLLFTDGAIQFTKRVLSVCTQWNVNCDNNNGRELPRQIERSTLHKHKLHQRWTVFW